MAEKKPRAPRKKAEVAAPEITAPVEEIAAVEEEVSVAEVTPVVEEEIPATMDEVIVVTEVHPTEEGLNAALDVIGEEKADVLDEEDLTETLEELIKDDVADLIAEEVVDPTEEEENSKYFARPRNPRLGKLSKWEAVVTEAGKEKVLYTGTEKSAKLVVQQHIRRTNR